MATETRLQGWRGYWAFARLAARANPRLLALSVVAVLTTAVAPLATVATIGALVGQIDDVAREGLQSAGGRLAVGLVMLAALLFFVQRAALALQTAATTALGERVDAVLQRDLMTAVMSPPGIGHMEDPATADLIEVGRDTFRSGWARPGRIAGTVSGVLTGRAIFIGATLMLVSFHSLLAAVLVAVGLWTAREDRLASRAEATHHHNGTEIARRTSYFHSLGVSPAPAKEVRVFGLAPFLHDRYMAWWSRSMADVLAPMNRRALVATSLFGAVVLATVALVARAATQGSVSPGEVAIYAQALLVGVGGIQAAAAASVQTELGLSTLERYLEAAAAVQVPDSDRPAGQPLVADGLPRHEIRFENVSFAYPGSDHEVLHELDLVIPAGRSLAIVGANGAGKTTLIKLLCQLYQPSQGRLTVDGSDLAHLEPQAWRRHIAAVFQDAVKFELSAGANVGFGRVDHQDELDALRAAAGDAGVADVIEALPHGWHTPLSSAYEGGVDLSGGEWQKLGLARALFAVRHGAAVLILDEPAAHLDARAEARLYAHFLTMTEGVTTVVISHRFSTVRQAASIVVLSDGRVAEQGTHDELMAGNGLYAEMFRLQAARFSDGQPALDGPAVEA